MKESRTLKLRESQESSTIIEAIRKIEIHVTVKSVAFRSNRRKKKQEVYDRK